jgi:hypothetical protein
MFRKLSIQAALAVVVVATTALIAPQSASAAVGNVYEAFSDPSKCMDEPGGSTADGTAIDIYACNDGDNTYWYFENVSNGTDSDGQQWFNLVNFHSGKCLTVKGGSVADYAPIIQYGCNNGGNEEWHLLTVTIDNVYGPVILINRASQSCVTVKGGLTADKTPLQLYHCNGGANQAWDQR